MDKIRRPGILIAAAIVPLIVGATGGAVRHFYPDDPIWKMPPPVPVNQPHVRKINLLYDFAVNSASPPGEKQIPGHLIPAQDVNTLGEVPDSEWYTNRHYWHPMSIEELRRGPDRGNEPVPPFTVTGAKTEGITPGFDMKDARGHHYFVKVDPRSNPEMSTGADVLGSKFFYALGYFTPENYIAYCTSEQVHLSPDAKITPLGGKERRMKQLDIDLILDRMPRDAKGRYRLMASLAIEGEGIGPLRWYGTRRDDPNDIYRHENRRVARGLYPMCAWLNHTDIKAGQTYDTVIAENGVRYIRHYLVDFGSMLGSDSDAAKDARFGHRYMISKRPEVLAKMFAAGLWIEDWERADYGGIRAVGRFTAEAFHPDRWRSNYPNSALLNRLPDDDFWGAKQVMAFTNEEIRAIVETGQYSDPRTVDYLVRVLAKRRDMVGRTFFAKVLPLDRFEIRNGELVFHNLAVDHGFSQLPQYRWEWAGFDNETGRETQPIPGATTQSVPLQARTGYVVATIRAAGDSPTKSVKVYVRGTKVVGLDRTW